MKVISIVNNKGGVGKTTLTQNLATGIANKGYSVGVIDLDPQANLSSLFKIENSNDIRSILQGSGKIKTDSFTKTHNPNLYILPNKKDISAKMFANLEYFDEKKILLDKFGKIDFDFLIIDTPPNLEVQTINSLSVSDYVIIPIKYDLFSLQGLVTVKDYLEKIVEHVNPKLKILGIVATFVDERESNNAQIKTKVTELFGEDLLKSKVRVNTKYKNSQLNRMSVYEHNDAKGINDMENLIEELFVKIKEMHD
ncbi:MAG: ParA family protein [candidate division SR1 bacterium]|nr:ParA family protein [candidate division SR1 bacterium]